MWIQRHPVMWFAAAMVLTLLLAALYVLLAADWLCGFSWCAGFPHTRTALAALPSFHFPRLGRLPVPDGGWPGACEA